MFILCQTSVKMAVLLHKQAKVPFILIIAVQFPKMNVRRLLSYEAKLLFSEGRGRM